MITPIQILEGAKALEASAGSLSEDVQGLDATGVIKPAVLDLWRVIAAGIEESRLGRLQAIDSVGDPIDFRSAKSGALDGTVRIHIEKQSTASTFYFFSTRGMTALLSDMDLVSMARRILIAGDFEAFKTVSCSFQPWIESIPDEQTADPLVDVAPRRFVKDLMGSKVPIAIGPFLLSGAQPAPSNVFDSWKSSATQQILRTLVNEVWQEKTVEMVQLSGPRSRRLVADLDRSLDANAFQPATDAARWVYASGRDIETRHTLLTYELATRLAR